MASPLMARATVLPSSCFVAVPAPNHDRKEGREPHLAPRLGRTVMLQACGPATTSPLALLTNATVVPPGCCMACRHRKE